MPIYDGRDFESVLVEHEMSDALMFRLVLTTVAKVEVDTQADRTLLVRWHLEGDPVPVTLAGSDSRAD